MATEYLLTSEDFIKSVTNISDNLSGKYLQGAIREAQEESLRSILGSRLLNKCKGLMAARELTGDYKELVDRCQYFLAYTAITNVVLKASYKITNFGVAKSNDENLSVATISSIVATRGIIKRRRTPPATSSRPGCWRTGRCSRSWPRATASA